MAINPVTGKPYESGTFDPKTGARTPKPKARTPKPSSGPRVPRGTQTVRQPGRHREPSPPRPTGTRGAAMPGDRDFGTSAGSQSGQTRPPTRAQTTKREVRRAVSRGSDPVARAIETYARQLSPYTSLKDTKPVTGNSFLERYDSGELSGERKGNQGLEEAGITGGFRPDQIRSAADRYVNPRGFAANLGSDLISTITGIGPAGKLAIDTAVYPVAKAADTAGFDENISERVEKGWPAVVRGTKQDIETRWGPLGTAVGKTITGNADDALGDYKRAGRQIYEHPGYAALDVLGAVSAAGQATRGVAAGARRLGIGARGGRIARTAERSILPEGQALQGGRVSTGARYRPPRERTIPVNRPGDIPQEIERTFGPQLDDARRATTTITENRRPWSGNPLVRPAQKAIGNLADKVRAKIDQRATRLLGVEDPSPIQRLIASSGGSAAAQRRSAKAGRNIARDFEDAVVVQTAKDADAFLQSWKQANKKTPYKRDQIRTALFLHAQGLLDDIPDMTPIQARDAIVQRMSAASEEFARQGGRTRGAQRNIQAIADLPDELVDLARSPQAFQDLVQTTRSTLRQTTQNRVIGGEMDRMGAFNREQGPARMMFGEDVPVGDRRYLPHVPVDRRAGRNVPGEIGPKTARLTPGKLHEWEGKLLERGNASMETEKLVVRAIQQGNAGRLHGRMVSRLVNELGAKGANGRLYTGRRAIEAWRANPDDWVPVSIKTLKKSQERRTAPVGRMPDKFDDGYVLADADIEKILKASPDDVVLLPKKAVNAVRDLNRPARGVGRAVDFYLNPWRRALLTLRPAWYVNNFAGNTLMFGFANADDIRAIVVGIKRSIRREWDDTIADVAREPGFSADVGYGKSGGFGSQKVRNPVTRVMDGGIRLNQSFENFFRRANYHALQYKRLKREGVKAGKLTPDETLDVLGSAPKAWKDDLIREFHLTIGDYKRLSPVEREVFRRVFPFYSWYRVIGRLMLSMPKDYPLRTAIAAHVSREANEFENPTDYKRRLHERGMVEVFGGKRVSTQAGNPYATLTGAIEAAGSLDSRKAITEAAAMMNPLAGIPLQKYSGRSPFDREFFAPPGEGGTVQAFGSDPQKINPVTGLPENTTVTPSLFDLAVRSVPLTPLARSIASGGRPTYDTTSMLDLLDVWGKPDSEKFPEFANEPAQRPWGGKWAGIPSYLGFPLYDRDEKALDDRVRREDKRYRDAEKQTRKRKRKNSR